MRGISGHSRAAQSASPRGDEELHIAFGAGDRAFHDAVDGPAAGFEPFARFAADPSVERGVADDAAFADFLAPDLELRFDERDQRASGRGETQRDFEHFGEADERGVAHDPVARAVDQLGRERAGVDLFEHGHARIPPELPGELVGADIDREDVRRAVLEQTNARALTAQQIDRPCDWVVCDASFIGLAKVLEVPLRLAARSCTLVALIKPQFEVGRDEVGKGGIVRDPALHARVCDEVREWLEASGWQVLGIAESPIKGTEGNVEFLIAARRS